MGGPKTGGVGEVLGGVKISLSWIPITNREVCLFTLSFCAGELSLKLFVSWALHDVAMHVAYIIINVTQSKHNSCCHPRSGVYNTR